MPLPAGMAAAAAVDVAKEVPNMLMSHLTNVKNRKFAREQYKTQRADALADFHMQNAYNSPSAQMARYKDAGLNPNLIYGEMTTAQPVRQSSPQSAQADAPNARLDNPYMAASTVNAQNSQVRLQEEQVKTQQEMQKYIKMQAWEIPIRAGKTQQETSQIMQNMGFAQMEFPLKLQGLAYSNQVTQAQRDDLKASASKKIMETRVEDERNQREWIMNNVMVKEGLERIKHSQQARSLMIKEMENYDQNMKLTQAHINKMPAEVRKLQREIDKIMEETTGVAKGNAIKQIEIELANRGILPGTPGWYRATLIELEKLGNMFNNVTTPGPRKPIK